MDEPGTEIHARAAAAEQALKEAHEKILDSINGAVERYAHINVLAFEEFIFHQAYVQHWRDLLGYMKYHSPADSLAYEVRDARQQKDFWEPLRTIPGHLYQETHEAKFKAVKKFLKNTKDLI